MWVKWVNVSLVFWAWEGFSCSGFDQVQTYPDWAWNFQFYGVQSFFFMSTYIAGFLKNQCFKKRFERGRFRIKPTSGDKSGERLGVAASKGSRQALNRTRLNVFLK